MNSRYSKLIHVTLSPDLVQALDENARSLYTSRSEFIRQALIDKIRLMHLPPVAPSQSMQIDLLMTDQQLRDTRDALNNELRRRHNNKWHRPEYYQ